MLSCVRNRRPEESVIDAFGRFVTVPRGLLAARDPEQIEDLAAITRVITESPALLAREQQIYAAYTDSLAEVLATETGRHGEVEPWVVARSLIGLHQVVVDYARGEIVAGTRNPTLARRVRRQTQRALDLLSAGLRDYGARPGT